MKNLDLLNKEKASIEALREEIALQRMQLTSKELLDKENLLKEKESAFQLQCKKSSHNWLSYNYHKIREINGFVLYNPIDQWTRKCRICGYMEITHVIPRILEKENNLGYELTLTKRDLERLVLRKDSLEILLNADIPVDNRLSLAKDLKKIKAKISRRDAKITKINKDLEFLRSSNAK